MNCFCAEYDTDWLASFFTFEFVNCSPNPEFAGGFWELLHGISWHYMYGFIRKSKQELYAGGFLSSFCSDTMHK